MLDKIDTKEEDIKLLDNGDEDIRELALAIKEEKLEHDFYTSKIDLKEKAIFKIINIFFYYGVKIEDVIKESFNNQQSKTISSLHCKDFIKKDRLLNLPWNLNTSNQIP